MSKKNLVVIFGGRSSEHEVSCVSAATVIGAVDKEKYNIFLVGITKDGQWLLVDSVDSIRDGSWRKSKVSAVISPDKARELVVREKPEEKNGVTEYGRVYSVKVDVAFPVLFRDSLKWQAFLMSAVDIYHQQSRWISFSQRLSLIR